MSEPPMVTAIQETDSPSSQWLRTRMLMRRPWLDDLPPYPPLPDGLVLRLFEREDTPALSMLLTRAFDEVWDEARVRRDLSEAPDVQAIYVVAHQGGLAATASARVMQDEFPGSGYVHWVAADPAMQGKGLGTLVTLRVLEHFRAAGLRDAVLETHNFRLVAQRTYLRLGFVPQYRDAEEQLRWARVLSQHIR